MRVRFSAQARSDLVAIGMFITGDNPARARSFVTELRSACEGLREAPDRFVAVKERPEGTVRRLPHRAYSVFYQVRSDHVLVMRIVHGAVVTGRFVEGV